MNALRAFEAAARLLSFNKAAIELSVTPAAVSQQIKKLEENLGVKLFHRRNRAITLTEEANVLLPGVRDGFNRLENAVAELIRLNRSQRITVGATPSFAAKWLVPRLERWTARNPASDVRVAASFETANFINDDVDLAIRYGPGDTPDLECVLLTEASFIVVCSPVLTGAGALLKTPDALREQTLIHVTGHKADPGAEWRQWLHAAGVDGVDTSRGLSFDDTAVATLAAIGGQGVLLARSALVADDIAADRLVRLFELSLPTEFAWRIVAPKRNFERTEVAAFRDWLLSEAQKDQEGMSE